LTIFSKELLLPISQKDFEMFGRSRKEFGQRSTEGVQDSFISSLDF